MKVALLVAVASLLTVGALGVVVDWRSAHPGEFERELRWLESYVAWRGEINDALAEGDDARAVGCERRLLELAGSGRTARLAALMEAALGGCRSLRRSIVDAEGGVALPDWVYDDWYATRYNVIGKLADDRARTARPERSSRLAEHVAP